MNCPLILIGGSLGGLNAARTILEEIEKVDEPLDASMVIILHRHKSSGQHALISLIQKATRLRVVEADDKDPILKGVIAVAPSDYHLLIEDDMFTLSVDEPVNYSRPSLDVALESAAQSWGSQTIAVILSGANCDGSKGATAISRAGGRVLVQDPSEAEATEMPLAAISAVPGAEIMTTRSIGKILAGLCGGARGR